MNYISTRGASAPVSSAEAIKKGLAPDGGLYMPETLPRFEKGMLDELRKMSYPERAAKILSLFLTDYDPKRLAADCQAAYSKEKFPAESAAPLRLSDSRVAVLELWHGPTSAFKDMALQIMPYLLSRALEMTGEKKKAHILVATSGDTGKAALEGYRDVPGVAMTVFYPQKGVSRIQKLQMATQQGANVSVHSVVGNFDDAQSGVKKLFSDPALAEKLNANGFFFSSANSINWGRLAPQIAYYVSAWCDAVNSGFIGEGETADVCVPTGNFGNIFAAYIAKKCGLPLGRLVCASNRNKVLTDFFETGIYDRRREFFTTTSPSMDILISSNLERLLYLCAGPEKTADYMKQLSENGFYKADDALRTALSEEFTGLFCTEEECAARIAATEKESGYLIDPHTAVGLDCANRYLASAAPDRKIICVSTASAFKFAPAVLSALGTAPSGEDFEDLAKLEALTGVKAPLPLSSLKEKAIRFDPDAAIAPAEMEAAVLADEKLF